MLACQRSLIHIQSRAFSGASTRGMAQKRPFVGGKKHFKNKKQKKTTTSDGSSEDVLLMDVRNLLQKISLTEEPPKELDLPEQFSEIELSISELSSTGDGLAMRDGQVYVVPFAAPGDTVLAKVYKTFREEKYALADFKSVVTSSDHRTETPRCPYFASCSGCQFQHLPYTFQLAHKRRVVEKAYQNFSNLPASAVPTIGETIGSPLQYGYRTKLTPHFDGPPGGRRDDRNGKKPTWLEVPPIGFMKKGTRKTIDIEDCPIGTDAVRAGMKAERARVTALIDTYRRGATLLLRENTERVGKADHAAEEHIPSDGAVLEDRSDHYDLKTCITDHNATSTEYVDDFRFDNPAGSFFQNNNSILPLVTQYIRDNILASTTCRSNISVPKVVNLIDAYCGSGFFTVALSSLFKNSIGIDISAQSIASANTNAKLNNLPSSSTRFIPADANELFSSVDKTTFPPAETVVIIDPPRKGCDENFIRQLMNYGPQRICYVSCNVHTQARDVGWLVKDSEGGDGSPVLGMYEIESLRGFDFFPQTSHVEGVAFLRKRGAAAASDEMPTVDGDTISAT